MTFKMIAVGPQSWETPRGSGGVAVLRSLYGGFRIDFGEVGVYINKE